MLQKIFLIGCFLFTAINMFSQVTTVEEKENSTPKSIYIENDNYSFLTSSFDKDLKINGFNFLIFDKENLVNNYFTFDFRNIGRKGSKFSYESYRDRDLYKHFPVLPDGNMIDRFILDQSSSLKSH